MSTQRAAVRRPTDTRTLLLRTAERLFAARGVDNVSMREIAAAAGQANHSAVLYHFTDKRELVNEMMLRHTEPVERAWRIALDHMTAEGHDTLEGIVGLYVRPVVAKLDDADGGTEFLQVIADLMTSKSYPILSLPAASGPGLLALASRMMAHLDFLPPNLVALRLLRAATMLYGSIPQYLLASEVVGREEFVNDLIASITAMLRTGAPPA